MQWFTLNVDWCWYLREGELQGCKTEGELIIGKCDRFDRWCTSHEYAGGGSQLEMICI